MSGGPELQFQRQIIESVKDVGGTGLKLSNRFTVGVPDLALQLPNQPTFIVEVKLLRALPVQADEEIKVALTPLQREFILDWQTSKGCAGLLVAYRTREQDLILCTRQVHIFPSKGEFLATCVTRKRGQSLAQLIRAGLLSPLVRQ